MEKICIVRRRIKAPVLIEKPPPDGNREDTKLQEMRSVTCAELGWSGKQHRSQPGEGSGEESNVIKIQLTPDQCAAVQSRGCLDRLFGGILERGDLDLERYEDGQVALNLHLKLVTGANMLSPKDVCRMLQISRSFLTKNVRDGLIKSYKIGKLRRFLLDDILDYLSRGKGFDKILAKVADGTNITNRKEQTGSQSDK